MVHYQPTTSCLNPTFDEHRWIMQIRRALEEEDEDEDDIRVSIFDVPKPLKDINPNAYTPQLVSLGPYHHWHPHLQEMERYKLSSTKRLQKQVPNVKFDTIVDSLMNLEFQIRARYHRYLDVNGETLAWMMFIDTAFVLEVINSYVIQEGNCLTRVSSRMSHLIENTRRNKSPSRDTILRDITMLENQIPMFVLREISESILASQNVAHERLHLMLKGLYKDLTPFKLANFEFQPSMYEHILDFFYQNLVPKLEEIVDIINDNPNDQEPNPNTNTYNSLSKIGKFLHQIALKIMLRLPWLFIHNIPAVTILKTILLSDGNRGENSTDHNKPPLVEEIMIPSVVELSNSGVVFCPVNGDITATKFDIETRKFYLPRISIDYNSEVFFRNLVAYEASIGTRALVFARYVELMNGIIDTKEDVRVQREKGVILNYLKSDEEVANLWNGMSMSLRLTKVPFLDQVIENVNKYYEWNWRVRIGKFFKKYVTINSCHFVLYLFAIWILVILIYELFYSVLRLFLNK